MEDKESSQKEPQDTIRQAIPDSNQNIIQETSTETSQKIEIEENESTNNFENWKNVWYNTDFKKSYFRWEIIFDFIPAFLGLAGDKYISIGDTSLLKEYKWK